VTPESDRGLIVGSTQQTVNPLTAGVVGVADHHVTDERAVPSMLTNIQLPPRHVWRHRDVIVVAFWWHELYERGVVIDVTDADSYPG